MIPPTLPPLDAPAARTERLLATLRLSATVKEPLAAALADPAAGEAPRELGGGWALEPTRHGGLWLHEQHADAGNPRPWAFLDRGGQVHGLLRWAEAGDALAEAALWLPGGAWLEVEPAAATHVLWGTSHRVAVREGERTGEVGCFAAVDFAAIGHIPPFDRPGGLPPGGGELLLNLLATLAAGQGAEQVRYRGPYPTELLFHSLRRSFRCPAPPEQALERFTRDEAALAFAGRSEEIPVAWRPDPFEAVAAEEELHVWLRDGVETAWLGKLPFRRGPEGTGALACGSRVWPETAEGEQEPRYGVGLVLLGAPYRTFAVLDGAGRVLARPEPLPAPSREMGTAASPGWRAAILAWTALHSTPALAPAVATLGEGLAVYWAALPASVAEVREGKLLLQEALATRYRTLAGGGGEAALMLISDVLSATLPLVRRLAQQRLEQEPPPGTPQEWAQAGMAVQAGARGELERVLPALAEALGSGAELPPAREQGR